MSDFLDIDWILGGEGSPNTKTWRLGDAEALHQKHPKTFKIPPENVRHRLTKGQTAKLLFLGNSRDPVPQQRLSERMWVRVLSRDVGGEYIGELLNDPTVSVGGLKRGSIIRFRAKNVLAVG